MAGMQKLVGHMHIQLQMDMLGKVNLKKLIKNVRYFATLYPAAFQVAVRADSKIKSFDDMKSANISPGKPKWTGTAFCESIIKDYGYDFSTIKKSIETLKLATSPAQEQGVKNQTQNIKVALVNKGSSLLQTDEYVASSDYFEYAYKLSPKDTVYLFYAASTAVNAKLYDRSLAMYEELRSLDYTGIEQNFLATNKETQVEEQFGSKVLRDLSIKSKTHINPKDETTKSKFPEIIKNIALIYVQNGENEKALQAMALNLINQLKVYKIN